MLFALAYVQRLALTFWLGEMLFFIVIFAPRVFRVLPRPEAALLQASIFPAYYLAGMVCAVLVLVARIGIIALLRTPMTMWRAWLPLALTLFAGLVFWYSYAVLTPKIAELQSYALATSSGGASTPQSEQFAGLHRLSVQVNGAALVALLALLALI